MKDAILVWFTTAIKRLFKVVQAQTKLQIEKSAGITVAGNLVTDMGSASRFELALFMRKLLTRSIFKNAWCHNGFKMFMLINLLFIKYKVS